MVKATSVLSASRPLERLEVAWSNISHTVGNRPKYSSADFLANQGVQTMIDANQAISHNTVIVIDGEVVLTGGFDFTKAAQEKNAENLLIIRDPTLATQYTRNWDTHRQHSQPYVGRGVR